MRLGSGEKSGVSCLKTRTGTPGMDQGPSTLPTLSKPPQGRQPRFGNISGESRFHPPVRNGLGNVTPELLKVLPKHPAIRLQKLRGTGRDQHPPHSRGQPSGDARQRQLHPVRSAIAPQPVLRTHPIEHRPRPRRGQVHRGLQTVQQVDEKGRQRTPHALREFPGQEVVPVNVQQDPPAAPEFRRQRRQRTSHARMPVRRLVNHPVQLHSPTDAGIGDFREFRGAKQIGEPVPQTLAPIPGRQGKVGQPVHADSLSGRRRRTER